MNYSKKFSSPLSVIPEFNDEDDILNSLNLPSIVELDSLNDLILDLDSGTDTPLEPIIASSPNDVDKSEAVTMVQENLGDVLARDGTIIVIGPECVCITRPIYQDMDLGELLPDAIFNDELIMPLGKQTQEFCILYNKSTRLYMFKESKTLKRFTRYFQLTDSEYDGDVRLNDDGTLTVIRNLYYNNGTCSSDGNKEQFKFEPITPSNPTVILCYLNNWEVIQN